MNYVQDVWLFIKMIALFRLCQTYVYDFRVAIGPSMLPTISTQGDLLLIDRCTPRLNGYRIGDIIILKNPYMPHRNLCKRIVGTAGGQVECEGQFYAVPEGHVWVEGDNKQQSLDSRAFGPVSSSLILGKVALKLWPQVSSYW